MSCLALMRHYKYIPLSSLGRRGEMKIQTPANAARVDADAQRLKLSLSSARCAEAVNTTRQSLARIEKGNGGRSFRYVPASFDLLNISLEAIPDSPQTLEGSGTQ